MFHWLCKATSCYKPCQVRNDNFANIIFTDSRAITLQILLRLPALIKVIAGKLFHDDWLVFNDIIAMKWLEYIRIINDRLTA